MKNYDYNYNMKGDVLDYIADRFTAQEIIEGLDNLDEWRESLYDDMFVSDDVAGNASGSFSFSRALSRDCVLPNMDLVGEMIRDFCIDAQTIGEKFIAENCEWFDVSIRCYLLGQVLDEALETLHDHLDDLRLWLYETEDEKHGFAFVREQFKRVCAA